MVQRCIANKVNISDQHYFCLVVMELINRAGLTRIVTTIGPFYPRLIR